MNKAHEVAENRGEKNQAAESPGHSASTGALPRLSLAGGLLIYQAQEIKQRLIEGVQREAVLELDLSQVQEIDSAGIQLLALAKRESQRLGHVLRIVGHSPAVRETIEFLNMVAYFGDPLVIPASDTH